MGKVFSRFIHSPRSESLSKSGSTQPDGLNRLDTVSRNGNSCNGHESSSNGGCTSSSHGGHGGSSNGGGRNGYGGQERSLKEGVLQQKGGEEEEDDQIPMEEYVRKVNKRLIDAYPTVSKEKLFQLAEVLVDEKKTKKIYFQHLVELQEKVTSHAKQELEKGASAFSRRGFHNMKEKKEVEEQTAKLLKNVGKLQVRLLFYELRQEEWKKSALKKMNRYFKRLEYGPFHTALQIGDIILEWDIRGVVIPRQIKYEEGGEDAIFAGGMHYQGELMISGITKVNVRAGSEATTLGYTEQMEAIVELDERRQMLIDELARVTVLYNRKYDYSMFSCNCHRFVSDVLEVLGIKNLEVYQEKMRVKQYMDILIERGNAKPAFYEFNSHAELDQYVRENIDRLSHDDLELCHCHYLLFHSWHQKRPDIEAWKCPGHGCCFSAVDTQL